MLNKLNTGFSRLTDSELAAKSNQIQAGVKDNKKFPQPNPTLEFIKTKHDAFEHALAMPDGTVRTQAVRAARADLVDALQLLARNLELTPGITDADLASTGFDMRKPATQSTEAPSMPENLRLKTTGVMGQVQFVFDPSDRARTYEIQTTIDPNTGNWMQNGSFSSSRGVIVEGLTRGKDIWGRVRAMGPNNTASGWSDPATVMVA